MRYRIEMGDDADLLVKHVHTNCVVAKIRVLTKFDPKYPTLAIIDGYALLDSDGAPFYEGRYSVKYDSVQSALEAVGRWFGLYPKLNDLPKDVSLSAYCEVECRLGIAFADAAIQLVLGFIESCEGGVSTETKERFRGQMQQLYEIWSPSLFGSYNAESQRHEPYFSSRPASNRRLDFSHAVQELGMWELTCHFPEAPKPILHELLMFVLKCFGDILDGLVPPEERKRRLEDDDGSLGELVRLLNTVAPRSASMH